MKIFVFNFREYDEKKYYEYFSKEYNCQYGFTYEYPSLENAELAKGYDAVNIIVCNIDNELLKKFYSIGIKYIITRSIGFDHIDINYAKKLGLKVSNVSYSPESVADYAIMLMMMSLRKIPQIIKQSEIQDYSLRGKIGRQISWCTVGIMGTGRIGTSVVKHLGGFGCRILAYDKFENDEVKKLAEYVSYEKLFKESDIISLHVPFKPENYHMINEKSISLMKDNVIIINTARGDLINTKDLINALEERKIAAAALDVIEDENYLYNYDRRDEIINNHYFALLRSFPNVILTPHTAFYTEEAISNMIENSFKSLYAFINNKENIFEIK